MGHRGEGGSCGRTGRAAYRVAMRTTVALVIALAACSPATAPARCTPGMQIPCACPGGSQGAQACAADGEGYGACACVGDAGGWASVVDTAPPRDVTECSPGATGQCTCGGSGALGTRTCEASARWSGCRCGLVDAGADVADVAVAVDVPMDGGPARADSGIVEFLPDGGCPPDYGNCDGNAVNGCEVDLRAGVRQVIPGVPAPNNYYFTGCGSCVSMCSGVAAVGLACRDGSCSYTCERGYYDCNGRASDGCESQLSDNNNCGACGNRCPTGQRCSGSPHRCIM